MLVKVEWIKCLHVMKDHLTSTTTMYNLEEHSIQVANDYVTYANEFIAFIKVKYHFHRLYEFSAVAQEQAPIKY